MRREDRQGLGPQSRLDAEWLDRWIGGTKQPKRSRPHKGWQGLRRVGDVHAEAYAGQRIEVLARPALETGEIGVSYPAGPKSGRSNPALETRLKRSEVTPDLRRDDPR